MVVAVLDPLVQAVRFLFPAYPPGGLGPPVPVPRPRNAITSSAELARLLSGGMETAAGVSMTPEKAMQIATVYSCVRNIAEDIGKLPYPVYRRTETGGKERATSSPFWGLIHDRVYGGPTSFGLSSQQFRETLTAWALLRGNGFAYKNVINGQVRELIPIHPTRVRIEQQRDLEVLYWVRMADGAELPHTRAQIFHFMGPSEDGIHGMSIVTLARQAMGLALAAEEFEARLFSNGARPSGVLSTNGELSQDARQRLVEEWQEAHGGLAQAHRVAVLEYGLSWQATSMSPGDAEMIQSRKFAVSEIARWFRMPPHKVGDMEHATYCLPGTEEVLTEGGPVPIRDVSPGTFVWSRQEGRGLALAPVRAVALSGYDRVLTIRTSNRILRANARHPVLARRPVYAAATSRIGGRRTAEGQWQTRTWETVWVPAGELEVGDTIVALHGIPREGVPHAPTRPHVSEGFMEFCGLLIGDGNVSTASGEPAGVQIARGEHAGYMDYYRAVMQTEFTALTSGGRGDPALTHRPRPIHLVEGGRQSRFMSKTAGAELTFLGFGGDARSKRVPGWVFNLTPALQLAFLRGYLDADGTVDLKGRITYYSASRELLSQMRHLCMLVGVPVTNLSTQRGTTRLPNGVMQTYELHRFTCSDPGANRRIGSHDPRYQARLAEGRPFGRKGRAYPDHGGAGFAEPGCELSRIMSIEWSEVNEPVYDLQVDGTHSFIAEGVVVHNTNIEIQRQEYATDTLEPWAMRWDTAINQQVIVTNEVFAEINFEGMLRALTKDRYDSYATAINTGWMTPNEARIKENLEPKPGLDEFRVPLNTMPASQLASQGVPSAV